MAPSLHGRLLEQAAREHLAPIGFRQRGRSRVWLADHGWYLVVVEFQPHAFAKGSSLNVALMWLWRPRLGADEVGVTFDHWRPLHENLAFRSEEQFAAGARRLARKAEEEAERLRALVPTVQAAAKLLAAEALPPARARSGPWARYHAGVVAVLAGRAARGRRLLEAVASGGTRLERWLASVRRRPAPPRPAWQEELAGVAAELAALSGDRTAFETRVRELIATTRAGLGLAPPGERPWANTSVDAAS